MTPTIVKADGSREVFQHAKLERSLKRSGATDAAVADIVSHIEIELADGMTTEEIYRHARSLLKKREKTAAAKYSLRRALFSLGPTGFPFEYFLARLYETKGYTTKTGVLLQGTCVEHEIDLIAYKADHCFVAEAKFHAQTGITSDLQVALYSHARFQDVAGKRLSAEQPCGVVSMHIITNTKFTRAAIQYAECVGMELLSWNYPKEKTLQDHIEEAGIYPITTLPSLSTREKRLLLEQGIVLCADMAGKRDVLRTLGLSPKRIETIITDSVNLCTAS